MEAFFDALIVGFSPTLLMFTFIGVALGLFVGAIPGLNQGMLMALALPLTFTMASLDAQSLLIGIYMGGVSGAMVSAILIGVPGTPAAVMTTFDGRTMAKSGRASQALAVGLAASFFGALISWVILATLSAPLARIAIKFSPFEFFAIVMMGMVLIAAVSSGSIVKGLLAGLLGMFFSLPGTDPITGVPRLTMGYLPLEAGLKDLPVLLGVFAVGQIIGDMVTNAPQSSAVRVTLREILTEIRSVFQYWVNVVRSSLIGTFIGILPGIGANVGSVVAYSVAKSLSRTPEKYGTGHPGGIVASEAGNNATVCGALVPMIALGIPGSGADVFLMAALILHNVQPGPLLFQEHPETFYGIIVAALTATLAMAIMLLASIKVLGRVVDMPRFVLVPAVLLFCMAGVYAFDNSTFDLLVLAAFGALGLLLKAFKFPLAPFIIGFILAGLAEDSLRSALMLSQGSFTPFATRPASIIILLIAVAIFGGTMFQEAKQRGKAKAGIKENIKE